MVAGESGEANDSIRTGERSAQIGISRCARAAIENVTADSRERALDAPFLCARLLFFSDPILDSDAEQIEEPSGSSSR